MRRRSPRKADQERVKARKYALLLDEKAMLEAYRKRLGDARMAQ